VAPVPGLPRFHGGFVGFLGYEIAGRFERLPEPKPSSLGLPDAALGRFDDIVVFDHVLHQLKIVSHIAIDDAANLESEYDAATTRIEAIAERLRQPLDASIVGARSAVPLRQAQDPWANIARQEYEGLVRRARQYIIEGEIIQVVPSRRQARPTSASPFSIYRTLRTVNPSPFMFYLDYGDYQLIGASPELLVKVEDGVVTTHPIAGTRRRGRTPEEDRALEEELLNDEKERAEHLMLVDLGRNDVGRVAQPGTVHVTQFMGVERYSHVMHLVSRVEGRLRQDVTAFDALRSCFPAGTVSGAPKIRAMEIINELEPDRRGPYAGAVGVFGYGDGLEVAITIRTITLRGGVAYVQSGGGIVFDSQPETEYEETVSKAQAMLRAIDIAEQGEV
jgi:anthranilate synthase component 1